MQESHIHRAAPLKDTIQECTDLRVWGPFPFHLENPNGRLLLTAADLMKFHGYTHMEAELRKMGADLVKAPPSV